jgi:hypothetical protein
VGRRRARPRYCLLAGHDKGWPYFRWLFDQCNLINTAVALGSVADKISPKRYIDVVDQTSFLIADDGQSRRDAVFMYSENELTAVRWMEYKLHLMAILNGRAAKSRRKQIGQGGLSPCVYNLYMDPKRQASQGRARFEWIIPQVPTRIVRQIGTFSKYPRKDVGLGEVR